MTRYCDVMFQIASNVVQHISHILLFRLCRSNDVFNVISLPQLFACYGITRITIGRGSVRRALRLSVDPTFLRVLPWVVGTVVIVAVAVVVWVRIVIAKLLLLLRLMSGVNVLWWVVGGVIVGRRVVVGVLVGLWVAGSVIVRLRDSGVDD